jgi:hypothetical protein
MSRNIVTITNGYDANLKLIENIKGFELATSKIIPEWDIEHFYYGKNLDMVTVKNAVTKEYADFNISANRICLCGCTASTSNFQLLVKLTLNDECYDNREE